MTGEERMRELKKDLLRLLTESGALRISITSQDLFTFKSGRKSTNMVNLRYLTRGDELALLKNAYADYIKFLLDSRELEDFEYVYGPAYAGISLAALACEGLSERHGLNKRLLFDRKEVKDYGDVAADKVIVGSAHFKPGEKILVLDDVVTTGGTKVEALEKLQVLGDHRVVGLIVLVDRQERMGDSERVEELSAMQFLEREHGLKCFSVLPMQDLFKLIEAELNPDVKQAWIEYYDEYGAVKLK